MREEVVITINEKVDKTIFFAKNNSSYQHYPPSHTHTHIFYIFFFLFHYKKIACGELQGTSRALEGKGLPLVRLTLQCHDRIADYNVDAENIIIFSPTFCQRPDHLSLTSQLSHMCSFLSNGVGVTQEEFVSKFQVVRSCKEHFAHPFSCCHL